jgi:putative nucleotide binding protein
MHALILLPGIGQKHMWEILEARERQKFGTFQDISDRTSISHPAKLIAQRIIKELSRDVKYYLFSKTQKYE